MSTLTFTGARVPKRKAAATEKLTLQSGASLLVPIPVLVKPVVEAVPVLVKPVPVVEAAAKRKPVCELETLSVIFAEGKQPATSILYELLDQYPSVDKRDLICALGVYFRNYGKDKAPDAIRFALDGTEIKPKVRIDLALLAPVFTDNVPLAIGIHKQLFAAYPELGRKDLKRALWKHVMGYRRNLKPGMQRWNLDSSKAGMVTEEEGQAGR